MDQVAPLCRRRSGAKLRPDSDLVRQVPGVAHVRQKAVRTHVEGEAIRPLCPRRAPRDRTGLQDHNLQRRRPLAELPRGGQTADARTDDDHPLAHDRHAP